MACYWTKLPDGTAVHVNLGRQRRKRCAVCGSSATRECDWCDLPICVRCSMARGDVDACPEHSYELREREAIQGADEPERTLAQ